MKKIIACILAVSVLAALLCGCGSVTISSSKDEPKAEEAREIVFKGRTAEFSCGGVSFKDGVLTISASGVYSFSGELENGQIRVNTGEDKQKVSVVLNGVTITNENDSAIYIERADKVKIYTGAGSENFLQSGVKGTVPAEDAKGAAIWSSCDVDFKGEGSLSVNGCINNGISCKKDINVESGIIVIDAVNNGIKAVNSVEVKGGELNVTAGNKGIKVTDVNNEKKGFVDINGGLVKISAGDDGIAVTRIVTVSGGELSVNAGGYGIHSGNSDTETGSMSVSGGSVTVFSVKAGIKAKAGSELTGGEVFLADGGKSDIFGAGNSQGVLTWYIKGVAGNDISLNGELLRTAEAKYSRVMYTSPAIRVGESYSLTSGSADEDLGAD